MRASLQAALRAQHAACGQQPVPSHAERVRDLRALPRFVREQRDALCAAIDADRGHRPPHKTLLVEIVPVIVDWRRIPGAANRVRPQPQGVVGVIAPWNFPLLLSPLPLVSIFATGNRALVKMSENSRDRRHPLPAGGWRMRSNMLEHPCGEGSREPCIEASGQEAVRLLPRSLLPPAMTARQRAAITSGTSTALAAYCAENSRCTAATLGWSLMTMYG